MDDITTGVLDKAIEHFRAQQEVDKYYNDPTAFAKDVLGVYLWSKQREVCISLQENKRTTVKAGHGVGKSYLAAILAIWWIATRIKHGADKVLVVSTAPTFDQVYGVIWENIRYFYGIAQQRYAEGKTKVKLPGYITEGAKWKTHDGTQIGFGRKPADGNDSAFQGFHKMYTLALIDEAAGIRKELWDQIEAITTQDTCRLLSIGNPTDPNCFFATLFEKDRGWNTQSISVLDSPNYTRQYLNSPDHPMHSRAIKDKDIPEEALKGLTGTSWLQDMIKMHGENSAYIQSRAYAEFPTIAHNTLFNKVDLDKGKNTFVQENPDSPIIFGVDVSRFGQDYSTIYKYTQGFVEKVDPETGRTHKRRTDNKQGGKLEFVDKLSKSSTVETANWVHKHALDHNATEVRVDGVGVGGGVVDQLVVLSDGRYQVVDMIGNAASPNETRWKNARAYWFDEFRRKVSNNEIDMESDDEFLETELLTIQYHYKNARAALQLESKDEMRSRGVKSPDFADAAAYAVADLTFLKDNPLSTMTIGDRIELDLEALAYEMDFTIGPY